MLKGREERHPGGIDTAGDVSLPLNCKDVIYNLEILSHISRTWHY